MSLILQAPDAIPAQQPRANAPEIRNRIDWEKKAKVLYNKLVWEGYLKNNPTLVVRYIEPGVFSVWWSKNVTDFRDENNNVIFDLETIVKWFKSPEEFTTISWFAWFREIKDAQWRYHLYHIEHIDVRTWEPIKWATEILPTSKEYYRAWKKIWFCHARIVIDAGLSETNKHLPHSRDSLDLKLSLWALKIWDIEKFLLNWTITQEDYVWALSETRKQLVTQARDMDGGFSKYQRVTKEKIVITEEEVRGYEKRGLITPELATEAILAIKQRIQAQQAREWVHNKTSEILPQKTGSMKLTSAVKAAVRTLGINIDSSKQDARNTLTQIW